MASFLRPKRGKKKTATDKLTGTNVLVAGELFMEVPDKGVGKGPGKIKLGDGITDYKDLPYFIDPEQAVNESDIEFTEASNSDGGTACNYDLKTKNSSSTLMTKIAGAIRNFHTRITTVEDKINKLGSNSDFFDFDAGGIVANQWKEVYTLPIKNKGKVLIICNIAFGHREGVTQDLSRREVLLTLDSNPVEGVNRPNKCWTSCAPSSDKYTACNSVLYIPEIASEYGEVHIFAKHTASGANIVVQGGVQILYL